MKKYFNKLNERSQDDDSKDIIYRYGKNITYNTYMDRLFTWHGKLKLDYTKYSVNFVNRNSVNMNYVIDACKHNKDKIVFFYLKNTDDSDIYMCSIDSKLYEFANGNNIYFTNHYILSSNQDESDVEKEFAELTANYNKRDVIIIDKGIEGILDNGNVYQNINKFSFINKDLIDFFEVTANNFDGEDYKGANIVDYLNAGYESIIVYFVMEDLYNIYNGVNGCYLQCAMTMYRIDDTIVPYINLDPTYIYSNNPKPDDLMKEIKEFAKYERFSVVYSKVVNNYYIDKS